MNTLKAEKRNAEEKAKRLRREGYVVGSVFGHKIEGSIPVKFAVKDAENLLRSEGKGGRITLDLDGTPMDVLIKEINYDFMKKEVLDIEFQALISNEKVHSVAEVVIENREAVKEGVLEELVSEISYRAYPNALVEKVKVDVSKLRIGDSIRVQDLDIAKDADVELITHPDTVVVELIAPHAAAEEETAEAAPAEDDKEKKKAESEKEKK